MDLYTKFIDYTKWRYKISEIEILKAKLLLAVKEIECLRSVLSEFEGDKHEYTQMIRADKFQDARETL